MRILSAPLTILCFLETTPVSPHKEGESWKPVEDASEFPVNADTCNRVHFKPVRTTALRLEVRLQPDFSGGILQWKIGE
jgi:hypothetical protein